MLFDGVGASVVSRGGITLGPTVEAGTTSTTIGTYHGEEVVRGGTLGNPRRLHWEGGRAGRMRGCGRDRRRARELAAG
jgi:hypothetical protein